mgnify:CR=1 FL=1
MKSWMTKHKQRKDDFISAVDKIYENLDHKTISQQRQDLIEVYSQCAAGEAVLCERYRKLKYDAEQALSNIVGGMYIGGATSLFTGIALAITQINGFLLPFIWICVVGGIIAIVAACLIQRAKRLYMKDKVLFLYPLEMELIEKELFQDRPSHIGEAPANSLPNEPDATAERVDTQHD